MVQCEQNFLPCGDYDFSDYGEDSMSNICLIKADIHPKNINVEG